MFDHCIRLCLFCSREGDAVGGRGRRGVAWKTTDVHRGKDGWGTYTFLQPSRSSLADIFCLLITLALRGLRVESPGKQTLPCVCLTFWSLYVLRGLPWSRSRGYLCRLIC